MKATYRFLFFPVLLIICALTVRGFILPVAASEGLDAQQILRQVQEGQAQLLDVREMDEWAAGHLQKALWVPLSGLRQGKVPQGIPSEGTIYLHCRSGRRVLAAQPLLEKMGHKNVIPLPWGYDALLELGFEKAR